MALSKFKDLYESVILEHSSNPRHHGELPVECVIDMNNSACGDVIHLTVDFNNDTISNLAFNGDGCSITIASASLMAESVIGKTKDEALQLFERFSDMLAGKKGEDYESLGEARYLSDLSHFPQRAKCSMLPWDALRKAVETGKPATEEMLYCHILHRNDAHD